MKEFEAPTPKSTYWEYIESFDKKSTYLITHRIWTLPMWTFHLLRKTAFLLDKLAEIPRKVIYRYEKDLSPKFDYKEKL